MSTQDTVATLLVAAALLAGACSKRSAHDAWSSSESIVVEPGVAIGSVHLGMTVQQVITELGRPDLAVDSVSPEINGALEYTNYGLYVIPGKGEVVHNISVGPPFAGRTKEGIGIGSSRADVIKAYGEPTAAKPIQPNFEVLRYEPLGLRFQLQDGKVDLFGVVFKTTK
ncbi:MAG: hypothetical protein WBW41_13700 [Verrucomicrobiia bacterium]